MNEYLSLVNTRIYRIWAGMKYRCGKSKPYIGITYDKRWESFTNFYDDMGESYEKHVKKYGESDTSIDRIDVNGNYCKNNCRWATRSEQQANRKYNVKFKGESMQEASLRLTKGGNKTLVASRMWDYGMDIEEAFTRPYNSRKWRKLLQLDMDGNEIKQWRSIKEASRTLDIKPNLITRCYNGYKEAAGGYKWKLI